MIRRARFVSIGSAVMAVLLAWLATSSPAVFAESDPQRNMAVVIVDSSSVRESQEGVPLTWSLLGLLASQQRSGGVVFIDTDQPGDAVGPFQASHSDFANTKLAITQRLAAQPSPMAQSIVEAISEAYLTLSANEAPAGSSIYVALGGAGVVQFDELSYTVTPLLNSVAEQGWKIHGVSLQAADQNSADFLDTISKSTGGQVLNLVSGADVKPLAHFIFGQDDGASIEEIASRTVVDPAWSSSRIAIMPGTEETTLYLFKEREGGSIRLINPSGAVVSDANGVTSLVAETDNFVIWRLLNPRAGNWRVETSGVDGDISIWGHKSNQYDLILRTVSPIPTGEPSIITAYVAHEGRTAVLNGVRMFATITGPDSSVQEYQLFDNGMRGDSSGKDGYYSAALPPLEVSGAYTVSLSLLWPGFDHRVTAAHTIEAQPFPSFHVETVSVRDLVPGEARNIGTVSIHLDGGPYAVDPSEIEIGLATTSEDPGTLELVPHRLYGEGSAWQFDILFTPSQYGSNTLQFNLSLEYAGRTYARPSSSIAISTVSSEPPAPVAIVPAAVEVKGAPTTSSQPPASQMTVSGVAVPPPPQTQFPWVLAAILMVVSVPIAACVAYLLTRPKPYGYIYTENEDELVDFSNLERQPIIRFFYRGLIRGSELNIPGFEGLVFHFMKDRVDVKSFGEHSTVRVNNQPLIDSATISDKTWIGTGGKLYTFLSSPIPPATPPAETAGAD